MRSYARGKREGSIARQCRIANGCFNCPFNRLQSRLIEIDAVGQIYCPHKLTAVRAISFRQVMIQNILLFRIPDSVRFILFVNGITVDYTVQLSTVDSIIDRFVPWKLFEKHDAFPITPDQQRDLNQPKRNLN